MLCFLHLCVCNFANVSNEAEHILHPWVGLLDAVCLMLELLSALLYIVITFFVSSGVSCAIHLNIVSVYACRMLYFGIFLSSSVMFDDTSIRSCSRFRSLSEVCCVGVFCPSASDCPNSAVKYDVYSFGLAAALRRLSTLRYDIVDEIECTCSLVRK